MQQAFQAPLSVRPRAAPRRRSGAALACAQTPSNSAPSYTLAPGEVGVRFTNTPSGVDVVAAAHLGDGLLAVGDSVGVHIPRACQSGLCGSCTCDIVDENAEGGFQTVHACQTGVVIPDGGVELVVDVARMKTVKKRGNPMARFENMDTEYVARAPPRPRKGTWIENAECRACGGEGDVECYNCDGAGVDDEFMCPLCAGSGSVRCADCQGTGIVQVRR